MRFRAAGAAIFLGGFSALVHGTTIVMPTDDQLIAKSPVILVGRVLETRAIDEYGGISTVTKISVEQAIKGATPSEVTVREVGGRVGDRFNVVFGSPHYVAGERVLVFLWPTRSGEYQTLDLFAGKFTESLTSDGRKLWFRDEEPIGTHLLDGKLSPLVKRNVQRLADRFIRYIDETVAGRAPVRDYELENPPLAREQRIDANFTLIGEPYIYRWFEFDTGGSATWKSVGSQPGFSGGGVSQATAAMNSWNNAPNTRIRHVYGGASSAPPGGLETPNGVNEILFNDPLNEIAGSFNPSTGGVLGRGGFNSVVYGGNWNSEFAADSQHPAATYWNVGNILEGNLIVQDGIHSGNFSAALLTAVLAHEFGHTLGLGHSDDPDALMYASLGGNQNGSLRADDHKAARWLYPEKTGDSSGPSADLPAPPSNLTAKLVNNAQIDLHWTVNATNASSQSVYLAANNSSFEHLIQVAPSHSGALLSSLAPGVTYRIRVTAKNSAGESAPSNTVEATIPNRATNRRRRPTRPSQGAPPASTSTQPATTP